MKRVIRKTSSYWKQAFMFLFAVAASLAMSGYQVAIYPFQNPCPEAPCTDEDFQSIHPGFFREVSLWPVGPRFSEAAEREMRRMT